MYSSERPVSEFRQDLKYGRRTLLKSRGFTAIAPTIGIDGNAAIFSFVNAVLLRPLPYAEPERIVRVLEKSPGGGTNGISALNCLDWAKENTVVDAIAAQTGGGVTTTGLFSSLLFGGGERDPLTIGGVAGVLATVALLACYFPVRRATKVNPIVALRCD